MSVYPVLEVNSLVGMCKQDLEQFKTEVGLAPNIDIPVIDLVTEPQHKPLKSKIDELTSKLPQGDYVVVVPTTL